MHDKIPAQQRREIASDLSYYRKRREVFDQEVKELSSIRAFCEIEDTFFLYGKFLERHPEALDLPA